jgi:hypothetical protein
MIILIMQYWHTYIAVAFSVQAIMAVACIFSANIHANLGFVPVSTSLLICLHLLLYCQVSKYFYENEDFAAKFETFVNEHANEGKQILQSNSVLFSTAGCLACLFTALNIAAIMLCRCRCAQSTWAARRCGWSIHAYMKNTKHSSNQVRAAQLQ